MIEDQKPGSVSAEPDATHSEHRGAPWSYEAAMICPQDSCLGIAPPEQLN